jgi:catechol 2,3-dioxygenase-like lactoylglutathione lyase family enzyme
MQALRFHHGGVSVPSLEAAINWYREMLSFEVEERFYLKTLCSRTAVIVNGGVRLELFEVEDAQTLPADRRDPLRDPKTHGNKHFAFEVEDLGGFVETMKDKGADIVIVACEGPASFNALYVRDCAGNLIEFVETGSREKSR